MFGSVSSFVPDVSTGAGGEGDGGSEPFRVLGGIPAEDAGKGPPGRRGWVGSRPAVQGPPPPWPQPPGRCLQEQQLSLLPPQSTWTSRAVPTASGRLPVSSCTDHSHPGIIPTRNFHSEQSSQE